VTPSATSENSVGVIRLIANLPFSRRFLRPPSTEAPSLHRSYRPALARISGLPTDADELKKLLTTLSAQAVIVSWYDDNEWILVSKQGTG